MSRLLFGSTKVPVIVFPLNEGQQVIALRHFRYGAGEEVLELPGGAIEKEKTPKQTVVSELKEEAGYNVTEANVKELSIPDSPNRGIWFDPAAVRVRFLPFFAKVRTDS